MKINRYQYIGNNKYQVWIDEKPYIFYEDVLLESEFLIKKEITLEFLKEQQQKNEFYEKYNEIQKWIEKKVRSKKEVQKKLQSMSLSEEQQKKLLEKLEKAGYLQDEIYARAYIHDAILFAMIGPDKLKEELLQNTTLNSDQIEEELKEYSKEIIQKKLKKYLEKQYRLNKKSSSLFKSTMQAKLNYLGFSKEDITEALNHISINEEELYQKEKEKQLRILSKKYQGKELEYQLKKKLYAKGFQQQDYNI